MLEKRRELVTIVILFVIALVLFFFGLSRYKHNVARRSSPPPETESAATALSVKAETVLENVSLAGYFTRTQRFGFGEEVGLCDSFVITSGDQALSRFFRDLLNSGNTVNSQTPDGKIIININIDKLSPAERSLVTASSPGQEVTLVVRKPATAPSGAPPCFSFVEIKRLGS